MSQTDEKYMLRCLQLAKKGEGSTKTNPMVGSVIVHNGIIIGEGYHRKIGEPHAEVDAINSVTDNSLLAQSTMYVSLEPCSHYGKTPPCAAFIVSNGIRRVVVAVRDPDPRVSGRGIQMLRDAGLDVTEGVLENEAKYLNRIFFTNKRESRPYIILKWAQTRDGFIDTDRIDNSAPALKLSNSITQSVVHKLRANTMGIMVGTNTALKDNPTLNTRKWFGDNPFRIVIDRKGKLPANSNLFNNEAKTIVFTELNNYPVIQNVKSICINFNDDVNRQVLEYIYKLNIGSVLIEGGNYLITSFVEKGLWDEAFVEISDDKIGCGISAPLINGDVINAKKYIDSLHFHIKRGFNRKFKLNTMLSMV